MKELAISICQEYTNLKSQFVISSEKEEKVLRSQISTLERRS